MTVHQRWKTAKRSRSRSSSRTRRRCWGRLVIRVSVRAPRCRSRRRLRRDVPANALRFSLEDAPLGASIDALTGVFSWTPTEANGPGAFTFDVVVTDDGAPALEDRGTITVTVIESNTAPVLGPVGDSSVGEGAPLSFTAAASDADVPANALRFSLADAPVGASIDRVDRGVLVDTHRGQRARCVHVRCGRDR